MIKRIFISFSLLIFLLAAASVYSFLLNQKSDKAEFFKVLVGNQIFEVEIADEPLEHSRGLSARANLPENQGMLFIFNDIASRKFWMVGMKFPLDIIWIRGDEIIGFSENLPPAGKSDYLLYSPPAPADKVLEINVGLVEKLGIKIGDRIAVIHK